MIKKTGKKLTKKVWAALLSSVLGLFIAVGGAITGIALSKNNRGGNLADSAADSYTSPTTVATFGIGRNGHTTYEDAWRAAIKYSIDNATNVTIEGSKTKKKGATVAFVLTEDWVASKELALAEEYTSFGRFISTADKTINDEDDPFFHGQINVPYGASIVLKMGKYKIDRALDKVAEVVDNDGIENGGVIQVQGAELYVEGTISNTAIDYSNMTRGNKVNETLKDKVFAGCGYDTYGSVYIDGAQITGAYGRGKSYGAIFAKALNPVGSGQLTTTTIPAEVNVKGVAIYNNSSHYNNNSAYTSGGISNWCSHVSLYDSYVIKCDNTLGGSPDGGGATSYGPGSLFNVYNSEFAWCSISGAEYAAVGGGLCFQDDINGIVVNSKFHHNRGGLGGGIGAWQRSGIDLTNCEVYENIGCGVGGGIGTYCSVVILNNVNIHDNKMISPSGSPVVSNAGGGIGLYGDYNISSEGIGNPDYVGHHIMVKGSIQINNNYTVDTAGNLSTSNVMALSLRDDAKDIFIDVTGALADDSKIGIFMSKPGEFTRGFVNYNPGKSASSFFVSDVNGYTVTEGANIEGKLVSETDPELMWTKAVKNSLSAGATNLEKLEFASIATWTSDSAGNFATGDSVAFGYGSEEGALGKSNIRVPKGANIELNLNDATVERKLSSKIPYGFIFLVDGSLTVTNGTIKGGNNSNDGGAFYVKKGATLTLNNVNIEGCKAKNGAAIYLEEGATLTLNGTEITGNTAEEYGAVYVSDGVKTLSVKGRTRVLDNTGIGGASNLYLAGNSMITGIDAFAKENTATGAKATSVGISLEKGSGQFLFQTMLSGSAGASAYVHFFADNDLKPTTGYLYKVATETRDDRVIFVIERDTSPTMAQIWSAIVQSASAHTTTSYVFDVDKDWDANANGVFGSGAGFTADGTLLVPANTKIIINFIGGHKINRKLTAAKNGSIIEVAGNAKLTIKGDGVITGGYANGDGGAIKVNTNGSLYVIGGFITGNKATGNGGAIYASGSDLIIHDTEISGNTAGVHGGGLYIKDTSVAVLNNTIITGNKKSADGTNPVNDNVYFADESTIDIAGTTVGTTIGVSSAAAQVFTSNGRFADFDAVAAIFTADYATQAVGFAGGEGYIGVAVTEPELSSYFTAAEAPKYKGKDGDGQLLTYDTVSDMTAVQALIDSGALTLEVKYKTELGGTYAATNGISNSLKQGKAGYYQATFTLSEGYLWSAVANRTEKSIVLEYEIAKDEATVTKAPVISGNVNIGDSIATTVQGKLTAGEAKLDGGNGTTVAGEWVLIAPEEHPNIERGTNAPNASGEFNFTVDVLYKFVPDDENIAEISGAEYKVTVTVKGIALLISEMNLQGSVIEGSQQNMPIDMGGSATFKFEEDGATYKWKLVFTLKQNGVEGETGEIELKHAPRGYTPYLTLAGSAAELNKETGLKDITMALSLVVRYRANTDTKYNVYYVLPDTNGNYSTTLPQGATEATLDQYMRGDDKILKAQRTGTTATTASVVDTDNYPFADITAGTFTDRTRYTVNRLASGNLDDIKIAGDGATCVVVYLTAKQYRVEFAAMGGTIPTGVQLVAKYNYNQKISNPLIVGGEYKALTMEGSVFVGWFTAQNGEGTQLVFGSNGQAAESETVATDDIVYYAHWENESYNITYHYERDTNYDAYKYSVSGKEISYSYQFVGASKTTKFAIDDSACTANPATYTVADEDIWFVNPTAAGFTFDGWYLKGTDTRVYVIMTGNMTGDIELYARWIPSRTRITFDGNGGTPDTPSKYYYNMDHYGTLPEATRSGYEFRGWYATKQAADDKVDAQKISEENTLVDGNNATLYAGWEKLGYELTFVQKFNNADAPESLGALEVIVNGDTENPNKNVSTLDGLYYGDMLTFNVSAKSGYRLTKLTINGKTMVNGANSQVTGDIEIEATFAINTYTINYDRDGGTFANSRNVPTSYNKNSTFALPQNTESKTEITRRGYNFLYWKIVDDATDTRCTEISDVIEALEDTRNGGLRNVTLKAYWKAKEITVYLHTGVNDESGNEIIETAVDAKVVSDAQIYINTAKISDSTLIGWASEPNSRRPVATATHQYGGAGWNNDLFYTQISGNATDYALYTVKPDDGNTLNHLYAIWALDGTQEVILDSDAIDVTYTGEDFTITAEPFYQYEGDDRVVVLEYTWYFKAEGSAVERLVATHTCSSELVDGKKPEHWYRDTLKIKNVKESGTYRVELKASGDYGEPTYVNGTGEIDVKINQAEYKNFKFENTSAEYNKDNHHPRLTYNDGTSDVEAINSIPVDGGVIGVSYKYTDRDNNTTNIREVGDYKATVSFTMPDYSNFVQLDDITIDYKVVPKQITSIYYMMVSVTNAETGEYTPVVDGEGEYIFTAVYNKNAYRILAIPSAGQLQTGDTVVIDVTDGEATNIGSYLAVLSGTISGADSANYELGLITDASLPYSITRAEHTFDVSNLGFKDDAVTYDGKLHEVYIKQHGVNVVSGGTFKDDNGYDVTVTYSVKYRANQSGYTVTNASVNGGTEAGEYTITATFSDADKNFNPVSPVDIKLTVKQADFFTYLGTGSKEALLGNFKTTGRDYNPAPTESDKYLFIDGSIKDGETLVMDFNDDTKFGIEYKYEVLSGGFYAKMASGSVSDIKSGEAGAMKQAGHYRLTAEISYKNADYRNNFETLDAIEIEYTIAEGVVGGIVVTMDENYEQWYGSAFDRKAIKRIVVTYLDENNQPASTEDITDPKRLNSAIIKDINGAEVTTFGSVGAKSVKISFLGKDMDGYATVNVKQQVGNVAEWQYSTDGTEGSWKKIPAEGLEYSLGGYMFRAKFACVNEDGTSTDGYANVTVDTLTPDASGKYQMAYRSTAYMLKAENTGNYKLATAAGGTITGNILIVKNKSVSAVWKYNGAEITENTTITYTGQNLAGNITVTYNYGDSAGERTVDWNPSGSYQMVDAKEYELSISQPTTNNNFELQGLTKKITVKPAVITADDIKWQYKNGATDDDWVDFDVVATKLVYKGENYEFRIIKTGTDIVIPVVGQKVGTNDIVDLKNAGTYQLVEAKGGEGVIANYNLSADADRPQIVINKYELEISWSTDEFTYDGTERTYTGTVAGVGADADKEIIDLSDNVATDQGKYNAQAVLKTDEFKGNYTIKNDTAAWEIKKRPVTLTWDVPEKGYGYTGKPIAPSILTNDMLAGDLDKLTLSYTYKQDSLPIEDELTIVAVGEYEVTAVFEGAASVLDNYDFGTDNAYLKKVFNIVKAAPDVANVTYNEYVTNRTYVDGASDKVKGLRADKLTATFNGDTVPGTFEFVEPQTEGGNTTYAPKDGTSFVLDTIGKLENVWYRFNPTDTDNYLPYVNKLSLTVMQDKALTGPNSLLMEMNTKQYSVDSTIDVSGTFYQKYASYYEEDKNSYGRFDKITETVIFTIEKTEGDVAAVGYVVKEADCGESGIGKLILKGSATVNGVPMQGSTELIVTKAQPEKIEFSEKDTIGFRRVWYVGEVFDCSNFAFTVSYPADSGMPNNTILATQTTYTELGRLTEAGNKTVEFTFFDKTTTVEIVVEKKQMLDVNYKDHNKIKWDNNKPINWDAYKVTFNEITSTGVERKNIPAEELELGGVVVEYDITYLNPENGRKYSVNQLTQKGTYTVNVKFIVSNPRYEGEGYNITYTLDVTDKSYEIPETERPFDEKEIKFTYDGEIVPIDTDWLITKPTLKDFLNDVVITDYDLIRVEYEYNGTVLTHGMNSSTWNITDAGTYPITVRVFYDDPRFGTDKVFEENYRVIVEQASNTAELTVASIKTGGTLVPVLRADFGAETVKLTDYYYREVNTTRWIHGLPTKAGKYQLKVAIAGSKNYKGINADDLISDPFEIRDTQISSGSDGKVEITDDDNGIVPGATLTVDEIDEGTLGEIKIKNANVLEGYDIGLKANGENVTLEGEVQLKLKLSEELKGRDDFVVYQVDDNGNATEIKVTLDESGEFITFGTKTLGRIVIADRLATTPVGLIAGVSVGAVVAAGLIAACILVFVMKRKR